MIAADALRTARERAGLSKRELARRAGTSPAAIVAYESGKRDPSTDTFARLLAAAGCHSELAPGAPNGQPDPRESAKRLLQVLELAEHLPRRRARRTLPYPRFG